MVDVLVAYATKYGSTRQVAEGITAALREAGASVSVVPAGTVREPVGRCDLVVLGGALYSGRWHRDAHRFLKRHRRELDGVPVVVFGMGPRDDTEEAWQRSRSQIDRALAKRSWLNPRAVAVFGGVDPPKRGGAPQRDLRNWQAIHTWATDTLAIVTGTEQDRRAPGR